MIERLIEQCKQLILTIKSEIALIDNTPVKQYDLLIALSSAMDVLSRLQMITEYNNQSLDNVVTDRINEINDRHTLHTSLINLEIFKMLFTM